MIIKSKIAECEWELKIDEIDEEDRKFIENFNPRIYHNDLTGKLWIFDTKLPSGKWIEAYHITNELDHIDAIIFE